MLSEKVTVVGEPRSMLDNTPSCDVASILHAAELVGTFSTQSDFGRIRQVSTKPCAASSSVIASSI
jgi:hypothetical protein